MPNIHLPCVNTNPSLLLIEPDMPRYMERAAQLKQSHLDVTRADNALDLYLMRDACRFSVAVLSDTMGSLALRATAQIVRGQWPKARILILGKAPNQFDDHLYDEAVVHDSSGETLLAVIEKVSEDPWNQRGDALAVWLAQIRVAPYCPRSGTVQESDPTKVQAPVRQADYAMDWPATERSRQVGHHAR